MSNLKQIYLIKYPNGKVYVGKDLTGTLNYFGSANSKLIAQDFSKSERKRFTITKEILWESQNATDQEVNRKEVEYIRQFKSNNPEIGYNQWPRYRHDKDENEC